MKIGIRFGKKSASSAPKEAVKKQKKQNKHNKQKKQKKSSFMKKFALALIACIILFVLSVGCALVGLVGGAVYAYIETAEPVTDEQLIAKASNRTTLIYDAKGNIMQKLTGKDNMDCEPVTDKEVSSTSRTPIPLGRAFYQHPGVIYRVINATLVSPRCPREAVKRHAAAAPLLSRSKNITGNDAVHLRKVQEAYAAILE